MSAPSPDPLRRRSSPTFQPRFTLSLAYLAFFFVFFCLVLILPELLELVESMPPGPELQQAAKEAAREAVRPRLPLALLLAVAATGLGSYFRVLPGLRR